MSSVAMRDDGEVEGRFLSRPPPCRLRVVVHDRDGADDEADVVAPDPRSHHGH
jgi:hypothetical protein